LATTSAPTLPPAPGRLIGGKPGTKHTREKIDSSTGRVGDNDLDRVIGIFSEQGSRYGDQKGGKYDSEKAHYLFLAFWRS
jgi:hypothetical protein